MEVYVRVREERGSEKEEKSQGAGQATARRQHDGRTSHVCSISSSLSWWRQHPVAYTTARRVYDSPSRDPLSSKLATAVTGRRQFPDFPSKYPLLTKCREDVVFRRILLFKLS